VSFIAITLCVASQRVFIVISLSTQSGNIWIHPRMLQHCKTEWMVRRTLVCFVVVPNNTSVCGSVGNKLNTNAETNSRFQPTLKN
jgi:hypothetical protein